MRKLCLFPEQKQERISLINGDSTDSLAQLETEKSPRRGPNTMGRQLRTEISRHWSPKRSHVPLQRGEKRRRDGDGMEEFPPAKRARPEMVS